MTTNTQSGDNTVAGPNPDPPSSSEESIIDMTQQPSTPDQTVKEPWPNSRANENPAEPAVASAGPKMPVKDKVDAIVDKSPDSLRVEVNGKNYQVSDIHNKDNILYCKVEGPGITDNDFRFVNPPIKVPDGAVAERVGIDGAKIKVTTFKEDPAAALAQIVKDAIQTVLTNTT